MTDTNTLAPKHYAERDHEAQGAHYINHVSAMTGEGLRAKSAIAAELAHRDIEIERLRAALAAPAQPAPALEALRHSANEWADMAINGLQWLRNIVDGTSEPKGALENMERCMVHCRSVNDAQPVQDAIRAASAAVPAAPAPVAPSDYDALRCAEGNCMFNGEVAQHAPDCTTTGVTAAPTDAELRGLWLHHAPNIGGPFSFARAVLAKWGA